VRFSCLPAYSSLLEPTGEDRKLLHSLVGETLLPHPDESTWAGFLEMVLLSKDSFTFQDEQIFLTFLKTALLSPKWGAICSYLEREDNQQLRGFLKDTIDGFF
jgi:hypothetical protein